MRWKVKDERGAQLLGYIPQFLSEKDPDDAVAQLHKHYTHGGGWHSFKGHTMGKDHSLKYPGDPPMYPIAETQLRDETILVYDHGWVAVMQKDGSFDVARMD